MTRRRAGVVCDLDGTLASCAWRTHLVNLEDHMEPVLYDGITIDDDFKLVCPADGQDWPCETNVTGKKDWDKFFDGLSCDAPVPAVRVILDFLQDVDLAVVLASGRPDDRRYQTEWWLSEHEVTYDKLVMRRQGDQRQDEVVKRELYATEIEPYYDVQLVIDDRPQVVAMWRDLDLPVVQVVDPALQPLLRARFKEK